MPVIVSQQSLDRPTRLSRNTLGAAGCAVASRVRTRSSCCCQYALNSAALRRAEYLAEQRDAARRVDERVVPEVDEHDCDAGRLEPRERFAIALAGAVAAAEPEDRNPRTQRERALVAEAAGLRASDARHVLQAREAREPLRVARGIELLEITHHANEAARRIVAVDHRQRRQQAALAEQHALDARGNPDLPPGQVGDGHRVRPRGMHHEPSAQPYAQHGPHSACLFT